MTPENLCRCFIIYFITIWQFANKYPFVITQHETENIFIIAERGNALLHTSIELEL